MKKLVLLAFCLCSTVAFAQNEVSLVVSADGVTKTQAIDNALRSAIEQTYGTFVSANTEILNDQLVKDEIATVSSGNIQKYSEIAAVTLPNGNTSVTLNVTVSLTKLISYAQSRGSECEFAGATFGANLRMYKFNKKNEKTAIKNMIKQLDALRPVYDYELNVSEPVLTEDGNYAKIKLQVTAKANEKTELFNKILKNTLGALTKTEEEIAPMKNSGMDFSKYTMKCFDTFFTGYLYNDDFLRSIGLFFMDVLYDFNVSDNQDGLYFYLKISDTLRFKHGYCNGQVTRDDYWTRDPSGNTFSDGKSVPYYNTLVCFSGDIRFEEISFYVPIQEIERIQIISIEPTKVHSSFILKPYEEPFDQSSGWAYWMKRYLLKYSFIDKKIDSIKDIVGSSIGRNGFSLYIKNNSVSKESILTQINETKTKY